MQTCFVRKFRAHRRFSDCLGPDQLTGWASRLRADLEKMARESTARLQPWKGPGARPMASLDLKSYPPRVDSWPTVMDSRPFLIDGLTPRTAAGTRVAGAYLP